MSANTSEAREVQLMSLLRQYGAFDDRTPVAGFSTDGVNVVGTLDSISRVREWNHEAACNPQLHERIRAQSAELASLHARLSALEHLKDACDFAIADMVDGQIRRAGQVGIRNALRHVEEMTAEWRKGRGDAEMSKDRRVVCAACKLEDGTLVIGARHMDGIMYATKERIGKGYMHDPDSQGFIDQRGVFMTREEAWKVAEAAGQILCRCGGDMLHGGYLYSENLY